MMNVTRLGAKSGLTMRGPVAADEPAFGLGSEPLRTQTAGQFIEQVHDHDAVLDRRYDAEYFDEYAVQPTDVGEGLPDAVHYQSLTPEAATVDSTGRTTRVADGVATIMVRGPKRLRKRRIDLDHTLHTGQADFFNAWRGGSLAGHVTNTILAAIAGKDPGSAMAMYTVIDHDSVTYVRNPDCWLAGVDTSAIAVGQFDPVWGWTGRRGGTLISPRHLWYTDHFKLAHGTAVRFVAMDGTVVERIVTDSIKVGLDGRVGVLDSDVPASIQPMKALPEADAARVMGMGSSLAGPLIIKTDQFREASVARIGSGFASNLVFQSYRQPIEAEAQGWYRDWINYDSGSPVFVVIGGQPVLLFAATYASTGSGSGQQVCTYIDEINAAMAGLGGGHSLSLIDVSAWPRWGNLCPNSQAFEAWVFSSLPDKLQATDNAGIAPDGSNTAALIEAGPSASVYESIRSGPIADFRTGEAHTLSIFFKTGGSSRLDIRLWDPVSAARFARFRFDADTETFALQEGTGSASFEAMGNGWYRLAMSGVVQVVDPEVLLYPDYSGQVTDGDAIYVWGCQVEYGDQLTEYDPT